MLFIGCFSNIKNLIIAQQILKFPTFPIGDIINMYTTEWLENGKYIFTQISKDV